MATFLRESNNEILGALASAHTFATDVAQREAWLEEIELLRTAVAGLDGHVFLEFDVPRLGRRIDAVLVAGPALVPMEFKVGAERFERSDHDQAWDYALDLKNFHQASHAAAIFPLLVATAATHGDPAWGPVHTDGVRPPRRTSASGLATCLREAVASAHGASIVAEDWCRAPYRPTPTIIEAAKALYARHFVAAISRSDAEARNLAVTSGRIETIIDEARREGRKAILFVTGVPGAGKTLVGLDVATRRRDETSPAHAVFLSGNGPLVAVLREALIRDEHERSRAAGQRVRKGAIGQKVQAFIQNIHHFRDDGLRDPSQPPADHVVIFDEAQRAWDQQKLSAFMRTRKGRANFTQSEPEVLIGTMDRHPDWAVIICLVGGGQEIHQGEAGIGAWLEAVRDHYPHWRMHVSPQLADSEYAALALLDDSAQQLSIARQPDLHLSVSLRSFRAENVARFVKAVLDGEVAEAQRQLHLLADRYPLVLTRDLAAARRWVRAQARGTERYGLVVSSRAERLKPHAIDVRVKVDPVPWFLNGPSDTRSSWYLEDAATEFQVQGLELDWICVNWDADLRRHRGGWSHHRFRSDRWEQLRQPHSRQYLLNSYRVLLTRARQGMVLFVPPGDRDDPTRAPEYYDGTFEYLAEVGVPVLEGGAAGSEG